MTQLKKQEILASQICNKPDSLSIKTCHESWGRTNPLCNEYENCRILEKSPEQIDYVYSSDTENAFLKACPGSGKTEVVGLKAAYTIKNWKKQPGGLGVLTFTNNAANLISQRVSQFTNVERNEFPHFIGTIDSWLHGYVAHPFAHHKTGYIGKEGDNSIRVVENSSLSPFLHAYQTKYGLANKGNILPNQYYYEVQPTGEKLVFSSANKGIDDTRNNITLIDWQIKDLHKAKLAFWKGGFATYQDIEYLCLYLLSEDNELCSRLAHRFPFIIIDECQDLSWIQLQILNQLRINGTILHFVGDLNQAIYDFKHVDPQQIESYTNIHKFRTYSLNENFRSCQPVIEICRKTVAKASEEKSRCEQKLATPCVCVIYPEDQMHMLSSWFSNYLKQSCCDERKSAIAARNWNNVSRLRPSSNDKVSGPQKTLAAAIYLWKSRNHQAADDALKYMGRFISDKYFPQFSVNSRKHYCPECIESNLHWRLFLSKVLDSCCSGESPISDLGQIWSEWAQCIRNNFGQVIRKHSPIVESYFRNVAPTFFDLDGKNFRTLDLSGNIKVLDTLPVCSDNDKTSLRITTIHSLKGETLDAILLVSAPTAKGTQDGFWKQWLAQPDSEAARLAYVASSRPKHLLAWALRGPIGKNETDTICKLGFNVIQMPQTIQN